jgi:hypothetical protein
MATWIDSQKAAVSLTDLQAFFKKANPEANARYHVSYIVLSGCGAAAGTATWSTCSWKAPTRSTLHGLEVSLSFLVL